MGRCHVTCPLPVRWHCPESEQHVPEPGWLPGPAAACCGWRNGLSWRTTLRELALLHWGSNGREDTFPLLSVPGRENPRPGRTPGQPVQAKGWWEP